MGGGALASGPSFDADRVAHYEGKTTAAGEILSQLQLTVNT